MNETELKIYSVSELNHLAQELLEENFSSVWIEGEISNYRGIASSGHCYFSLKDGSAQVDTVAFRSVMQSLKFKLEDGLKVLVLGRVSLYAQRGRFQVIANQIEPKGAGALQLAFEQLKKKLEAEGLFDPARKKAIPSLPQKIGIVTSPTGAALRDILTVINRRFANVEILIYPAKVQGEGAKEEIAEGVRYLNDHYPELDVLLVGRGGGSIEDLWAFNEEVVARAIAASKIPVISCVGHEIDFTIADFVADLRAPTPSAAAELVVKNKSELNSFLTGMAMRLNANILSVLEKGAEKLKGLARARAFARPKTRIDERSQTLDYLTEKLGRNMNKNLETRQNSLIFLRSKILLLSPESILKERKKWIEMKAENCSNLIKQKLRTSGDALKILAGSLDALSPLAVLSRGYSIVWTIKDQKIVKSSSQTVPGDSIRIKVLEGEFKAVVQETNLGEIDHGQKGKHAGTEKY